jgi:hypothetical protein
VGGPESATINESYTEAIKVTCYHASKALNWTIDKSYLHNIAAFALAHMNGVSGFTFSDSYYGPAWGKEAIRGQIAFLNSKILRNIFVNACGSSPGEGCTAEIALWDGSAGNWDANEIHGNIINCNGCDGNSSSVAILVGGNGSSWVGSPASNTLIYNNTIVGSVSGSFGNPPNILVNGGSGNVCRNNLWYSVTGTPSATCSTQTNNGEESTSPFVNHGSRDFHLSAALAGVSTGSPTDNATDIDGVTRGGDGTFDRGAFEYVAP